MRKMIINLKLTMESGQPPNFIWSKDGDKYFRYIGGEKCYIWEDNGLRCTEGFEDYVLKLLRGSDDLNAVYKKISTDAVTKQAIKKYSGLRVTLSDPWETLVCFICSVNNNIPRIRRNVQSLMREGRVLTPEEILRADLSRCCLGFREKFLRETAELALSYDLEKIGKTDYKTAKQVLMELPGVGAKVADCALLYGYGVLQAFPIDVWIQRAMEKYYRKKKPAEIRKFAEERWGSCAGYANTYLYAAVRGI
ncbi:MAG: DNA glycosylase [Methanobacteriota archaeon]